MSVVQGVGVTIGAESEHLPRGHDCSPSAEKHMIIVLAIRGLLMCVYCTGAHSSMLPQVFPAIDAGIVSLIAPRRPVCASAPRTVVDAHTSRLYVGSNASQWNCLSQLKGRSCQVVSVVICD